MNKKYKYINIFYFTLLLFSASGMYSQTLSPELLSSAGFDFKNIELTLSWSIGEIQTEYYTNEDHILWQGFHYYYGTSFSEISEELNTSVHSVYPNPFTEKITLHTSFQSIDFGTNKFLFRVYSSHGKLIYEEYLNHFIQEVELSKLSSGIYIISLLNIKSGISSTTKIVKK